ncbi:MAG: adenosylcobinamide amidohydrolase [Candidatus Bathyarchaeota archaeon]|nr:adenosylcobinamide amidohydrolase [Candidatus Bathyarchaeota archaeon]
MKEVSEKLSEKKLAVSLKDVEAKVIYPVYRGFRLNTLLIGFEGDSRVLSTLDGYRKVSFVGNTYTPLKLSERTMKNYREFKRKLPLALGLNPKSIAFLSTSVDMDNLAVCEKSYEEFTVCCFATAGAKGNALRTGVDEAVYVERDGKFVGALGAAGTINVILLTNAALSDGAMARAIITVTEAKTAALQDLNVKSVYSYNQATGTGTDNIIVASGKTGTPLLITSGHTKMGELIGCATKIAVADALKKHDGS